MIPRGICIDLETTITAKISDAIRATGSKRFETRIIEIGACHWRDTSRRFMRLVNPISVPVVSGAALMQHLKDIHQKPVPTLNFWSKVLVKRKSVDRTMFSKEEDPAVWLARKPEYRAEDFAKWFNGAPGPDFVSETAALRDLLAWTGNNDWLAHNGNSFDFKVLQGCAERTGMPLPSTIRFHDTLKLFRKLIPGHQSYSQPKIYEKIFSEKYNAHVAIDDSLALARLCVYCNKRGKNALNSSSVRDQGFAEHSTRRSRNGLKKIRKSMDLTFPNKDSSVRDQGFAEHSTRRSRNGLKKIRKSMDLTFPNKDSQKQTPAKKPLSKKVNTIAQLDGIGPKSCKALASHNINSLDELFLRCKTEGYEWLKEILPYGVQWRRISRSIQTSTN